MFRRGRVRAWDCSADGAGHLLISGVRNRRSSTIRASSGEGSFLRDARHVLPAASRLPAAASCTRRGRSASRPPSLLPGLTVLGSSSTWAGVSGAHLNPAVTLAFAMRGDFPWKRVRATSSSARRRDAGVPVPPCGVRQHREPGSDAPGPGYVKLAGVPNGDRPHPRLVSLILGLRPQPERRSDRRAGVGGYNRARRANGGSVERRIDEPRALVRPGLVSGHWTSYWVLPGRPARRRDARGRLRMGSPRGVGDPISYAPARVFLMREPSSAKQHLSGEDRARRSRAPGHSRQDKPVADSTEPVPRSLLPEGERGAVASTVNRRGTE